MKFFAIDEPRSPARALYATLISSTIRLLSCRIYQALWACHYTVLTRCYISTFNELMPSTCWTWSMRARTVFLSSAATSLHPSRSVGSSMIWGPIWEEKKGTQQLFFYLCWWPCLLESFKYTRWVVVVLHLSVIPAKGAEKGLRFRKRFWISLKILILRM